MVQCVPNANRPTSNMAPKEDSTIRKEPILLLWPSRTAVTSLSADTRIRADVEVEMSRRGSDARSGSFFEFGARSKRSRGERDMQDQGALGASRVDGADEAHQAQATYRDDRDDPCGWTCGRPAQGSLTSIYVLSTTVNGHHTSKPVMKWGKKITSADRN